MSETSFNQKSTCYEITFAWSSRTGKSNLGWGKQSRTVVACGYDEEDDLTSFDDDSILHPDKRLGYTLYTFVKTQEMHQ